MSTQSPRPTSRTPAGLRMVAQCSPTPGRSAEARCPTVARYRRRSWPRTIASSRSACGTAPSRRAAERSTLHRRTSSASRMGSPPSTGTPSTTSASTSPLGSCRKTSRISRPIAEAASRRRGRQLRPPVSPTPRKAITAMARIGIILGSTRPNRNGEQVAQWVFDIARQRADAEFELVDLRDYPLPHFDEPMPPALGQYAHDHTKEWAQKIASFDGFVMVTPEYNHSTSGVLKNAIDYLYAEWNNKAVGFVSYGSVGGARAAEQLRLVVGELQMADVRQQVALSLLTEFENYSVFKPGDYNLAALSTLLDQVIAWSSALAPLRQPAATVG